MMMKTVFAELKETVSEIPGKQIYEKSLYTLGDNPKIHTCLGIHFNEKGCCDYYPFFDGKFQSDWHKKEYIKVHLSIP